MKQGHPQRFKNIIYNSTKQTIEHYIFLKLSHMTKDRISAIAHEAIDDAIKDILNPQKTKSKKTHSLDFKKTIFDPINFGVIRVETNKGENE